MVNSLKSGTSFISLPSSMLPGTETVSSTYVIECMDVGGMSREHDAVSTHGTYSLFGEVR